jgi:NACalpha-BTF3-like transcription factor
LESYVTRHDAAGIWQFGALPKDAQDALSKTGWIEKEEAEEAESTPSIIEFDRADIEIIVERAVADETFADERSKEVFPRHRHSYF